ncbi:hypothetical protein MMC14_007143 [Varicellaria rhodocarpa]|nr:hypothetical protein [Varicellaria rhodocarpa]
MAPKIFERFMRRRSFNQNLEIVSRAGEEARRRRTGDSRRSQSPTDIGVVLNKGYRAQRVRQEKNSCMQRLDITRGPCTEIAYPVVAEAMEPSLRCEGPVSRNSQTWEETVEEADRRWSGIQRFSFQPSAMDMSRNTSPRQSMSGSSLADSYIDDEAVGSPRFLNCSRDGNRSVTPSIQSNFSELNSSIPSSKSLSSVEHQQEEHNLEHEQYKDSDPSGLPSNDTSLHPRDSSLYSSNSIDDDAVEEAIVAANRARALAALEGRPFPRPTIRHQDEVLLIPLRNGRRHGQVVRSPSVDPTGEKRVHYTDN